MTDETTRNPESTGAEPPAGTEASEPGQDRHRDEQPGGGQPGSQRASQAGAPTGPQAGPATEPAAGPGAGPGPGVGTATRPPLRRSVTDRKVAGVCGGLGRHLDVDPVIFRVLFGVFAFFGGASVLLYGLGWLLVPAEDKQESDGQRLISGRGDAQALLAVVAVVLGFVVFVGFLNGGWDGAFVLAMLAGVIFAVVWASNRGRAGAARWQPPSGWGAPAAPPAPGQVAPWWQQPGTGASAAAATATSSPSAPAPAAPGTAAPGGAATGTSTMTVPDTATGGPPAVDPYGYPPPAPPRPRRPRSVLPWIALSAALIAVGVLVALGMSGVDNITAQVVLATVLIVLGAGLVVGTWFGRARSLIALGSVVTVALVSVSTYSVPLRGGAGNREWVPVTVAAVQTQSPYRLAAGEAVLDVTELDPKGATVKVVASVVFGQLTVRAPDNVRLVVHGHTGMGSVILPNGTSDGVPAERDYAVDAAVPESKGTIELTLNVGMGELEVERVAA